MHSNNRPELEEQVLLRIKERGGSIDVYRGKLFETTLAHTLGMSGVYSNRAIHAAVQKLVQEKRLKREDRKEDLLHYGSLSEPRRTQQRIAKFSIV